MKRNKMIEINGSKLKEAIFKRGMTESGVALEIGYDPGYIRKACSIGKLNRSTVKMLQTMYHINPDYFVIPEEPKEVEPVAELRVAEPVIDYDKLKDIIYDAVYQAVKNAWSE